MVGCGWSQMTTDIFPFPWQQWLRKSVLLLRYRTLSLLVLLHKLF